MSRAIGAVCLLILASSASAQRTLKIVEYAIEAPLSNLILPAGATGTVIVNGICDTCPTRNLLAGIDTRYLVRDTNVPHDEFMRQLQSARNEDGESALVGVYYDAESERVTRIKLVRSDDGDE